MSTSGKLTEQQKANIRIGIEQKETQFLVGELHEIHVKLTPQGLKKYNAKVHLRPLYETIIDDDIYVFRCTQMQIEFFFLEFGADAQIISPEPLRQRFADIYNAAAAAYSTFE